MATNLNLDSKIDETKTLADGSLSWAQKVINLVDAALRSNLNPFGSASKLNAGTAAGNVVQLDGSAKVPSATLPNASEGRRGVVEIASSSEIAAGTDNTRVLTPAGLLTRSATTTRAGVVRLATEAEVAAGTSETVAVSPKHAKAAIGTAVGGITLVKKITVFESSQKLGTSLNGLKTYNHPGNFDILIVIRRLITASQGLPTVLESVFLAGGGSTGQFTNARIIDESTANQIKINFHRERVSVPVPFGTARTTYRDQSIKKIVALYL